MSYSIYYPYNEHFDDIEVVNPVELEEDEYNEGYMYNYVHILQHQPYEDDMDLINEFCPNISIIEIIPLETMAIAINGAGMDFSAEIEMAYLIIDGRSPIIGDPFYFSEEQKNLLEELRKDVIDGKDLARKLVKNKEVEDE